MINGLHPCPLVAATHFASMDILYTSPATTSWCQNVTEHSVFQVTQIANSHNIICAPFIPFGTISRRRIKEASSSCPSSSSVAHITRVGPLPLVVVPLAPALNRSQALALPARKDVNGRLFVFIPEPGTCNIVAKGRVQSHSLGGKSPSHERKFDAAINARVG